jgi:hypothetical protein
VRRDDRKRRQGAAVVRHGGRKVKQQSQWYILSMQRWMGNIRLLPFADSSVYLSTYLSRLLVHFLYIQGSKE